MKFRRLATAALAAVTALGMSLTAAADVVESFGNVSVTAYSLGDSTAIENLLFTELEDGTYEVGYNYNGAKPVGTVIIPETANGRLVTRIAEAGFYNCTGLTNVVMPDSIISVGANAFTGTAFLNNQSGPIKYAGKVAVWCDENAENVSIAEGTLGLADKLFTEAKKLKAAMLPEGLINLGYCTFDGCSKLVSVYIPSSVTVIQSGVFSGCTVLSSVTIPQSVTAIGAYAFESSGITAADLTNVTVIGKGAFENSKLAADSVIVSGGYMDIGSRAFAGTAFYDALGSEKYLGSVFLGCGKNVRSVAIREGTTAIAGMAFSSCASLTDVVIPAGVITIGDDAFFNCPALSSLTLPEGVTGIGKDAFRLCSGIKTVSIPLSLTSAERGAFYGCDALEMVTYPGSIIDWRNIDTGDEYSLPSATVVFGQEPSTLEPVTGLTVTAVSENSVSLAWDAHSIATTYRIDVYQNGVWFNAGEVEGATSFTVTGLKQRSDYIIHVNTRVHNVFGAPAETRATTSLAAPTNFKGKGYAESIVLTWDKNNAADSYQVDILRDNEWQSIVKTADNKTTSYKVTGLSPSTSYTFRIYSFLGSEYKESPTITVSTTPLPETPTGLTATTTENSVTLSWNASPNADSYEVDIFKGGKWTLASKGTGTTATVTELSPYTSYQFRVFAFSGDTYSSSARITATTQKSSGKPGAVTGFTATTTSNSVTLSWDKVSGADSYQIDVYQNGAWKYLTKTSVTSYTATGLSANTSYQFRIFAFNGDLYSAATKLTATTKTASSSTTPTKPGAVTGFTATTTSNSVTLSWNAVSGADSYQIDVYQNGKWSYVAKTSATSYTVTQGLSPNTGYQFRIFAFNGDLYSSSVKLTATTKAVSSSATPTKPSAVTSFAASSAGNSIALSWNSVSGADSYQIDIFRDGAWKYLTKTSGTSYTATGLSANTSYQFRIFAFNGDLYSSSVKLTAMTSAATATPTKPSAVTGFKASATANTISLSWNKVSGADSYQIDVYQNGKWSYVAKTSATSYTVTQGLSAGTSYQFRIFAFNGDLYSSSVKLTATTTASASNSTGGKPNAVTGFKASATSNSVSLSWNAVSGADSYQIDVYKNGVWTYLTKTTGTSYRHTGLSANTNYQYRIFAFKGSAYSSSVKLTATTVAAISSAKPSTVTGFAATSTTDTVTLTWNRVSGADSYQIDVYENGSWKYVAKTAATSYTVTQGLTPGKTYQFRIFAFNGEAYSSSVSVKITTKTVLAPMPYGQSGGGVSEVFTKLKGIDVSGWQGVIDFNTVKESGVDFVIVKAGEKYSTMETWETNYANAKRAGLLVGAYWFSHATTPAAAQQEAQAFIAAMRGKSFDFPVYLDIERNDQFDIGIDACTQVIDTFCTTLENAGYYAGVYCSTYWYTNYVHESVRLKRPAWIADYRGNCYYDAACGMWQYGYGNVDGVESDDCDLNWGYIDYSKNILAHRKNGN